MYGKLFESTFTGSLLGKGPVIIAVWCYAIAHTKPDGLVELNPDLLTAVLGCKSADVQAAIKFLCAPDAKSRTKTEDGKRLFREGEYLFRVVNHALYNSMRNEPERREYNRIKQQESRARKARQTKSNGSVKHSQARQPTHTHASDSDTEEAAAFDISECPKDMDAESEHRAFCLWHGERGKAPTEGRWRNWVLRAKESGRYAKQAKRPPTKEEIAAEHRKAYERQQADA